MAHDEYHIYLGKLLGNFQSLEFILRGFLQQLPSARPMGIPHWKSIYSYKVGEELPVNEMTSYDSLEELIHKFNSVARKKWFSKINIGIAKIRDAIAHGKVSLSSDKSTPRLLKFSKPKDNKVTVIFNEILNKEWFTKEIKKVHDAIIDINDILKKTKK